MTDYDVIVIGAGSVGVPTTYFLAQGGMKVLCLDSNSASGQGQNKSACGGVRASHSDPAKIKICQESLSIFSSWEGETGDNIGWKKGGYCFPVYREQDEDILKSVLPLQKRHGINIDWFGAKDISDAIPGINPNGLRGGTISPDDGQVSPLLASESFTNHAKKLGAHFNYSEEVIKLETDEDRVTAVKTTNGRYTTDFLVNAAGSRASDICRMVGLDIPVISESHEGGISAPVKQFLNPLIVDLRPGPEGKTANFYFAQNLAGKIIFCYTPKQVFTGENRESTSEFMPIAARRLVDIIPRLKNILIRRVWRGLYPMTPDGVPVVDKAPGYDNFLLGIGMCGQGFMLGSGVGKNITEMIIKGKPLLEPEVAATLRAERDFYNSKHEALK